MPFKSVNFQALSLTLFKPKKQALAAANKSTTDTTAKAFDDNESGVTPTKENAEIVIKAYSAAMQNNEPNSTLAELNTECMKEYGMRCYMDKDGKFVACDSSGSVILKK
jgi:hypothetical protein